MTYKQQKYSLVGLPHTEKIEKLIVDVSVNVSLLFTLVMVDVSNICEERFGRPQMSQFQDMFLKPCYTRVFIPRHFLWDHLLQVKNLDQTHH
jgi:hypothetical protein